MSDDLDRDETVLGTALSRAIESQPVRETPFERSRVMARMAARPRSILTPLFAAAAAIVLGLTLGGALLAGRGGDRAPVASNPSTTPTAPLATQTAAVTATPNAVAPEPWLVYFARDSLPPVAAPVQHGPSREGTAVARIGTRLSALWSARSREVPAGAFNGFHPSPRATQRALTTSVSVDGDVATVTIDAAGYGWDGLSSSEGTGLIQQLVYTITEEPGIRRAAIREPGKDHAVIGNGLLTRPLTREDVFGYSFNGTKVGLTTAGDSEVIADLVDWRASVDEVAPGLGRFVAELRPRGVAPSGMWVPRFTADLKPAGSATSSEPGKWVLWLTLPDAMWPPTPGEAFHCCPVKMVDKTPIRQVTAQPITRNELRGVTFGIYLDDARPWRVTLLPSPLRLVVDIGGVTHTVSDSIAVYAPRPATDVGREFTITGLARTFEANVQWRLKDNFGRVVAQGHTTASIGTSPVWGTFSTSARVPANVTGFLTLQVFWGSPKDGSDQGTVHISVSVR